MNSPNLITLSSTVSAVQDQISSSLGDEAVILQLESGTYYGLNEVGARVWQLICESTSVQQIRDALLAEYDVEAGRCEQDLLSLLQKLADESLIEVTHATAV
jgi:hypothetical protein